MVILRPFVELFNVFLKSWQSLQGVFHLDELQRRRNFGINQGTKVVDVTQASAFPGVLFYNLIIVFIIISFESDTQTTGATWRRMESDLKRIKWWKGQIRWSDCWQRENYSMVPRGLVYPACPICTWPVQTYLYTHTQHAYCTCHANSKRNILLPAESGLGHRVPVFRDNTVYYIKAHTVHTRCNELLSLQTFQFPNWCLTFKFRLHDMRTTCAHTWHERGRSRKKAQRQSRSKFKPFETRDPCHSIFFSPLSLSFSSGFLCQALLSQALMLPP